jgi:HPt (histidine-containing phosphotransfer) domain-containing protein
MRGELDGVTFQPQETGPTVQRSIRQEEPMPDSHQAPRGRETSIIDLAAIEMLRELGGDDGSELLAELVGVFLADAPERMADAARAVASGDFDLLERAAHTLKSSAAQLGAVALSARARDLEIAARGRDADELQELTARCGRALAEASLSLQQWGA